MATSTPDKPKRRLLELAFVAFGTFGLIILALSAVIIFRFVASGGPVADEWVCSQGKAPATFAEGGGACYPEGSDLPAGAHWDPLGNRPLIDCANQDGFVRVRSVTTHQHDCIAEDRKIPHGWRRY